MVDPAAALDVDVTLADGSLLSISVTAETDRTTAGLTAAVLAAIPDKLIPGADGDVISISSLGKDTPTSVSDLFSTVSTG